MRPHIVLFTPLQCPSETSSLLLSECSAIKEAEARASVGSKRKELREEKERMEALRKVQERNRRMKRERIAVVKIQCLFRGYIERKAAAKWRLVKREIDARRALEIAASVSIQRVYRGYIGETSPLSSLSCVILPPSLSLLLSLPPYPLSPSLPYDLLWCS